MAGRATCSRLRHHGCAMVCNRGAAALYLEVSADAIATAGLMPGDIDGMVTVSTTGIAAPSLEARVGARLGHGNHVQRVPSFGLGCAGGTTGLAIASRLASSQPG